MQDGDTTTCKDIIEEAKDGLIPLAACVKMSQGFQEVLDEQVAVLLAGWGVNKGFLRSIPRVLGHLHTTPRSFMHCFGSKPRFFQISRPYEIAKESEYDKAVCEPPGDGACQHAFPGLDQR